MKLNSSTFITMVLVDNTVTNAVTKVERSIRKIDDEIRYVKKMAETQDLDSVAAMFLKRQALTNAKEKMANMYRYILHDLAKNETLHEADFSILTNILKLIPDDGEYHNFRPFIDEFDEYLTDIIGED